MVELLKEAEAEPDLLLAGPDGLSDAARAIPTGAIWERLESIVRLRWCPREVIWIVKGVSGEEWVPPLSPITAKTAEHWSDGGWSAVTLTDGPLGYCLPESGTLRVTATVGDGHPPNSVFEAYRRLAEYWADEPDRAGVSSYSVGMGGAIEESYSRSSAHAARALQNSGAADLLRPYWRLK